MLYLNIEGFYDAASAFYKITHTQISLYDENFELMASYPDNMCEFCSIIRSNREIEMKCIGCDRLGFDRVKKTKKSLTYHCHMGLTETITPILCEGKILGYIILGQMIDETNIELVTECAENIKNKYDIDYDKLKKAINEHPKNKNEFITNAAKLLEMASSYFWTNNIISTHSDSFVYNLKRYIHSNLNKDLSVSDLCRQFNVSASSMYRISTSNFKMGISRYITLERLTYAKELLNKTDFSLDEICGQCGISDTSYLVKLFKKEFGITPRKYRAKLSGQKDE